ncbi:MAG: hypothetical protein ACLVL2_02045 [Bacteroides cellulosilyticus]
MNNKLFTFLDPLLGYIDNGRFFREPFRWLYVIFAVLNLLFPIFILAKVIEMDFFKYAEGKLILAFILLFIILCAGAWGSYLLWMNRKNKLKEAIQEENEFIAIPVVSHLTQTMGEWLGLYIGVIGTLCSVVIAIFAANEIRYILPIPSGMFFLMPIYGFPDCGVRTPACRVVSRIGRHCQQHQEIDKDRSKSRSQTGRYRRYRGNLNI